MASRSVQDLLARVRQVLQDLDAEGYRYPTGDLIGYLNDAVLEAYRLRPDLFVGRYAQNLPQVDPTAPDFTTVDFPLTNSCFVATVNYVAGRAEIRDDEYAVDGRAMTFLTAFTKTLMGGQ
jgi:hypothetical protein